MTSTTTPVATTRPKSPPAGTISGHRTRMRIALLVGLLVCTVFVAFPVFWMLVSSFKTNVEIFATPPKIITKGFSVAAYTDVLQDSTKLRFFANSYLVAFAATVLTVAIAIQTAYALSRYDFKLKNPLTVAVIGTQAVPPIALVIPYFGLMVAVGLYNTYAGLIITHLVLTLPYATLMMTGYFNTIPKELDEAVRVDGGGPLRTVWRVLVPISVPGIVAVAAYTFTISWNEFLFALTLTQTDDKRTVPIGIQMLIGQNHYDWNQMMSMSILGSLPILVLFLIFQRWFISGLAAGSVKG